MIVQPDDDAERNDVRLEWIHERAAERVMRQWPAERMHDRLQRPLRFPDLLDSERVDLGVLTRDVLPIEVRLRECAARAFRERDNSRRDVGRRLIASSRPALTVQT